MKKSHQWPEQGKCLFGPWALSSAREGKTPPMQYRSCVHPDCNNIEKRVAPSG